jgi:PKD repeat protein
MKKQTLIILILLNSILVINAQISADFIADRISVQNGQSVTFTDRSTGNPTSWSWSFPGATPSTSTSRNPTVTYDQYSTEYDVTLTVSDGKNTSTKTKEKYISVYSVVSCQIWANFSASSTSIDNGGTVNFTDNSVSKDRPKAWEWSFPGGTPSKSTVQNPTNIKYNTSGKYEVTLKAYSCGSDIETKKDYINVGQPVSDDVVTVSLSPSRTQGYCKKQGAAFPWSTQSNKVGHFETQIAPGFPIYTYYYFYRQEFSHPAFTNSQIKQIKFTFQIELDSESPQKTAYAVMFLQPSDCQSVPWSGSGVEEPLYNCMYKNSKLVITPLSVKETDKVKTMVAVIDGTSNVMLNNLNPSATKFTVGFWFDGFGLIRIKSTKVAVTYTKVSIVSSSEESAFSNKIDEDCFDDICSYSELYGISNSETDSSVDIMGSGLEINYDDEIKAENINELKSGEGAEKDIYEINKNGDVLVAPNPSEGIYNLKIISSNVDDIFFVINMFGKIIGQYNIQNSSTIDISHFPSGTYILMYKLNGIYNYKKLVKV